ncbi:MAG: energy transducer TonB [Weeksellaceae bacterium]|nr:energy transducer TonB [Weeksellaceae bacterium]
MKNIFLLLLLSFGLAAGQTTTTDEHPRIIYTQPAQFPGGDEAFLAEFHKMVRGYIDMNQYAANGVFNFIFDIDVKGKITNLQILPKVKNSEMFIEDMMFAVKRIKPKWTPALRDGNPVKSTHVLKVTFTSDHFDHD